MIATLGGSRFLGLHVIDEQSGSENDKVEMMRAGFEARCREAGIKGQFAIEEGEIGAKIVQRSIYADGVIIPFNHPPATVSERYSSGLQTILRRSPRPVLTVPPGEVKLLTHALLAYGGNYTTADEALFVAAYLNARYQIKLSVISVGDNIVTNKALAQVRKYLVEIGAEADFFAMDAPVEEAITDTAVQTGADFLIMGSISYSPLRSLLLGSTANRLLSEYAHPILFCR
jgi:nucleotide-binding universal stress UspA family protein